MSLVFRPPQRRKVLTPSQGLKIDWTHPLTNGLIACYVPGVSGGINLAGMGGDLAVVTAAQNIPDVNSEGVGLRGALAGGLKAVAPAAFLGGTNTFYWRGVVNAAVTGTGGVPLLGIEYSDPEASPFLFQAVATAFSAGGAVNLQWNSGGSSTSSATVAPTLNVIVGYAGTFNPGGNAVFYINGAVQSTTAYGASAPNSTATSTICLDASTADVTREAPYTCNVGYIWNRVLSASEVAALNSDPYCFLIPAEGEMPALYNPVVLGSGQGEGIYRRAILQAYSGGLNLPGIRVPRGMPKIDWTHPLANGLVGCWLPGVSFGIDLTGTCPPMTSTLPIGNTQVGMGPEGPVYNFNGSGANGSILSCNAPPAYQNWSKFSLYYRGPRQSGLGQTNCYLLYVAYTNGVSSPYDNVGIGDLSLNDLSSVGCGWNDGSSEKKGTAVVNLSFASTISVLGTFAVSGNATLYSNGALIGSDAWGSSSHLTSATDTININGWLATSRTSPTGCNIACAWNRELSAAEAAALDADPYCFLIPAAGEMPALYLSAGGGGGGFIPAWARGSNLPIIGTGNY